METLMAFAAVCLGLALRFALPISITLLLGYALYRLDARWQAEAQVLSAPVQKPECWKIKDCLQEEQKKCAARTSPLPCWQVFRLPNGYLCEQCISCKVFLDAPVPT
jgi:hypothetical protein